jgi:retinol dehydrogenase 12
MATPQPRVVTADLTGKVVAIVGANIGLGFEASKHVALVNPCLGVRTKERGNEAIRSEFNFFNLYLDLTFF